MRSGQFPDTPFERRLMAIYHLHARTGSRDGGQSAAATAAYLARIAAYGKTRHQVVHLETGHMPVWAVCQSPDRRSQIGFDYWLAADTYERANGRLFKEVEFALPIELKPDKRLALAREFALALTADIDGGNLPFALSIHRGSSKTTPKLSFYANEDLNPHCHLLISERVNDGEERTPETWFKRHGQKQGGARKTDKLKSAEWLQQTRALWAEMCNRHLQAAGFKQEVDHRSYRERGIAKPEGFHVGMTAMAMKRDQRPSERDQLREEIAHIPERIVWIDAQTRMLNLGMTGAAVQALMACRKVDGAGTATLGGKVGLPARPRPVLQRGRQPRIDVPRSPKRGDNGPGWE